MKLLSTPFSKSIVLSDDESCKIPSQKDNNGKVLSTDGTNLSWVSQASSFNLRYDKYEEIDIYFEDAVNNNKKEYLFNSKCLVLINGNYISQNLDYDELNQSSLKARLSSMTEGKYLPSLCTLIVNKGDKIEVVYTSSDAHSYAHFYFSIIPLE